MSFLSATFLVGLVAVAGPVVIHLLNRRRFRTIEWAAMEFLREAVQRNRRVLELRDLLLLVLRTVAVLLFVLAMARPFWSRESQIGAGGGGGASGGGQPVHAVLVLDNSLSMGYAQLDKSLLDLAKEKARAFIDILPRGSPITIIPMCPLDDGEAAAKDVYAVKEDALEALSQIKLVDRVARASDAARRVQLACAAVPDVRTKRIAFLGDLQRVTWAAQNLKEYFKGIDQVQIVQLGPEQRSNSWVADFRLRDGVADAEAPAVFVGTLRHEGAEPRRRVRVSLKIDDAVIEERFVDLMPGQSLQLTFQHKFDVAGTSQEPLFAAARLELSADHLAQDDFRQLVVPVVAAVPVLFVDQYGAQENPRYNRYGDTFPLRRLLAPRTRRTAQEKALVQVRHVTAAEVTREQLKDARLVVIAGVKAPTAALVRNLREYVEQGGSVFLAAGGEFDPQAWTALAWLEGEGILPAPLKPQFIGALPNPGAPGAPGMSDPPSFRLAAGSMQDELFHLGLPEAEAQDLYARPFFYKAVGVDLDQARQTEGAWRARLAERRQWLADFDAHERAWAEAERAGRLAPGAAAQREADRRARDAFAPKWLAWSNPPAPEAAALTDEQLIARARPWVMGRFSNQEVFAVRREIGQGRVVMLTTGAFPQWNNLATEYTVVLLDQALRALLTQSFPVRTLDAVKRIVIPVEARDLGASFTLQRPDAPEPQALTVEALGEKSYGLHIRGVAQRGLYRIKRGGGTGDWMVLAVNGPSEEGELAAIDPKELAEQLAPVQVRFIAPHEPIRLEGTTLLGYDFWKYLMAAALVCLLAEMVFLALPATALQRWGWLSARAANQKSEIRNQKSKPLTPATRATGPRRPA